MVLSENLGGSCNMTSDTTRNMIAIFALIVAGAALGVSYCSFVSSAAIAADNTRLNRVENRIASCLALVKAYDPNDNADGWMTDKGPSSSRSTRAARAASLAREIELKVASGASLDEIESVIADASSRSTYQVIDALVAPKASEVVPGKYNPAC
jgi:hypothetical protein